MKFPSLQDAISKRVNFINEFEAYIANNKSNPFVASSEIGDWANRNHLDKFFKEKLFDTGYINWGIAARITEPSFMKSLIPQLNEIVKETKASIIGVDERKKAYLVKPLYHSDITLNCSYFDIVINYAGPIFGEALDDQPVLTKIIHNATIFDDTSLNLILSEIESIIRKRNYYFYDRDFTTDELIIHDNGKYIRTRLAAFANRFIYAALSQPGQSIDDIIKYIKEIPGKRYTKEEIYEIGGLEGIMKSGKYGA